MLPFVSRSHPVKYLSKNPAEAARRPAVDLHGLRVLNQADRGGPPDPIAGTLTYTNSPWIAWGPYIWADGSIPRSDGLTWCAGSLSANPPCSGEQDYQTDLLHPNATGQTKVADMLWKFFSTSAYTTPWFLGP